MRYLLSLILVLASLCAAREKTRPTGEAGNDNVDIYATPLLEKEQIQAAVGAELPPGIIVVQVRVVPKGEEALSVSRDDFQIISHKDGQRSGPFVPSQIVGNSTLVISTVTTPGGGVGRRNNGPIWGGIPGTMGRPSQMPGDGASAGSATTAETQARAKAVTVDPKQKEDPLLAILAGKMLADKESKEPLSGLLYFPLEGKQKLKDIELIYKGPAGRLIVPFAWK